MVFADVSQKVVDIANDVGVRCLNAGDDLRKYRWKPSSRAYVLTDTWGMTSSHVSTSTVENPLPMAWLTSSW